MGTFWPHDFERAALNTREVSFCGVVLGGGRRKNRTCKHCLGEFSLHVWDDQPFEIPGYVRPIPAWGRARPSLGWGGRLPVFRDRNCGRNEAARGTPIPTPKGRTSVRAASTPTNSETDRNAASRHPSGDVCGQRVFSHTAANRLRLRGVSR